MHLALRTGAIASVGPDDGRLPSVAWIAALAACVLTGPAVAASDQVPQAWQDEWPRTDFDRMLVDPREILSGGPPKDGIPSIDAPRFRRADDIDLPYATTEPVMSVELSDDARAYPLSVLMWHEIVNDTVGGLPVAVTFCPLCNAGMVFERTVEGAETTFGTTGKLRNSDLVMYDRATESWWQQFSGEAIAGARAGAVLRRVPARLEAMAEFQVRSPQGKVLVPPATAARSYGRNPYRRYDTSARPFLFRDTYDGPGRALMRVVAVDGRNEAWSLDFVRQNAPFDAGDLRFEWRAGQNSALDTDMIREGRDVGTVTVMRRTAAGEETLAIYDLPFAFAFRAFRPDAEIHHTD